MLVLSRKLNESIVIDDEIVITVLEVRGDKVRLGFEADSSIPIFRKEIHGRTDADNTSEHSSDSGMGRISDQS